MSHEHVNQFKAVKHVKNVVMLVNAIKYYFQFFKMQNTPFLRLIFSFWRMLTIALGALDKGIKKQNIVLEIGEK